MGNQIASWKRYYDLGSVARGQRAIEDMGTWRAEMAELLVLSATDAAEVAENADEASDEEEYVSC